MIMCLWSTLKRLITSTFLKKRNQQQINSVSTTSSTPLSSKELKSVMMPKPSDFIPGAPRFTWEEALYLPKWKRCANEQETPQQVLENLPKIFTVAEKVQSLFGKPVIIHCAYRPPVYNKLVGGSEGSAHLLGLAIDFHIEGRESSEECAKVRQALLPKLAEWGIRMENKSGPWIHIDLKPVGPSGRFFPA